MRNTGVCASPVVQCSFSRQPARIIRQCYRDEVLCAASRRWEEMPSASAGVTARLDNPPLPSSRQVCKKYLGSRPVGGERQLTREA